MYLVRIKLGVAVGLFSYEEIPDNEYYEITEEQFNSCTLPCRAEVTEGGVIFGDIVPWEEVPDAGVVVEDEPDPIVPETDDVSWEAMAEAIKEGVNDV